MTSAIMAENPRSERDRNDDAPSLEAALALLDVSDSAVASYVVARRAGFAVLRRRLSFDDGVFTSFLTLQLSDITKELHSNSIAFHSCAFSHLFTSIGLLLRRELPTSVEEHVATPNAEGLTVEIRYGLMSIEIRSSLSGARRTQESWEWPTGLSVLDIF
jgi:hypothetical protein